MFGNVDMIDLNGICIIQVFFSTHLTDSTLSDRLFSNLSSVTDRYTQIDPMLCQNKLFSTEDQLKTVYERSDMQLALISTAINDQHEEK